jgi:hypothetical protein
MSSSNSVSSSYNPYLQGIAGSEDYSLPPTPILEPFAKPVIDRIHPAIKAYLTAQAAAQGWPSRLQRGVRDISLEKPLDPSYLGALPRVYTAQPRTQIVGGYFDQMLRSDITPTGAWPTDRYVSDVNIAFDTALSAATNHGDYNHFAALDSDVRQGFNAAETLQNFIRNNLRAAAETYNVTGSPVSHPNNVVRDFYSAQMNDIVNNRPVDFTSFTAEDFAKYWQDYGGMEKIRDFYSADTIGDSILGTLYDYDLAGACANKGDFYWRHLDDALTYGLPGTLKTEAVSNGWKFWRKTQYKESMNYQQNPAGMPTALRNHFIYYGNDVSSRLFLRENDYRLGNSGAWIPYNTPRSALSSRETVDQTNRIIREADQRFGNKWWYCRGLSYN